MSKLRLLAEQSGFEILEQVCLPERIAKNVPVPDDLHPKILEVLSRSFPKGLYAHQAQGLKLVREGNDICLATPTASGKSLIFMMATADRLMRHPELGALALYPAKALIQDQLSKWKEALKPLGRTPGYIDGAVPIDARPSILEKHPVVLMTPDVAHAWLMSHLQQKEVQRFLSRLRLLILDEAHVYDGVFGTNMAYFIRRLLAVSAVDRVISSTATIGEPGNFIKDLTGRKAIVLNQVQDGARSPKKTVMLARPGIGKLFEKLVRLVVNVAQERISRFLAFGDSRRMVEQLVAVAERSVAQEQERAGEEAYCEESRVSGDSETSRKFRILPYRAGYEEEDRKKIQKSLMRGDLSGVIATSALELGLDIGEIDVVLLLGTPPSVKAFWQRLGRAGRKNEGLCILIDDRGMITSSAKGLDDYLRKIPEPAWLYLDNPFIQYSHALCAAYEAGELGKGQSSRLPFQSLPPEFTRLFENELNPTESVPDDLYPLKQRAQAGPHYEFPLRSVFEKNFEVKSPRGPVDNRLGTITFAQALREAYPGSIYYYMARPYRVHYFNFRTGEIRVKQERHWTTKPELQNVVFPKFPGGVFVLRHSKLGFITETEVQVSERVLGFTEQRGPKEIPIQYGKGSPYSQRPVSRFFETTGVCWFFPNRALQSESVAQWVLGTFCSLCGIQARDLGMGVFHAKASSVWSARCQGICIYDAVHGSLRLTKKLMENISEILGSAIRLAQVQEPHNTLLHYNLGVLEQYVNETDPTAATIAEHSIATTDDWIRIIAPDQPAIQLEENGSEEVRVITFRYTPQGPMYQLESTRTDVTWMVRASSIKPIHGITEQLEINLITGETRPLS